MAHPVSWLLVEPGWAVVDGDGNSLGEVREVVGDTTADIFDGLHVSGAEGDWYVAATRIGRIVEGEVEARRQSRSEERRVGKECRSRWSPYH